MATGIDLIQGTAFSVSPPSTTATAPVTIKNAQAGDKVLNVFVLHSVLVAGGSTASLNVSDITSSFGTNLVGDVPGNLPRIVCYNTNAGGFVLGDGSNAVLVSVDTTGTKP